jgi:hypothetical protein
MNALVLDRRANPAQLDELRREPRRIRVHEPDPLQEEVEDGGTPWPA